MIPLLQLLHEADRLERASSPAPLRFSLHISHFIVFGILIALNVLKAI